MQNKNVVKKIICLYIYICIFFKYLKSAPCVSEVIYIYISMLKCSGCDIKRHSKYLEKYSDVFQNRNLVNNHKIDLKKIDRTENLKKLDRVVTAL